MNIFLEDIYVKALIHFNTESSRFDPYKDFPESGSKPVWIQSRSQTQPNAWLDFRFR